MTAIVGILNRKGIAIAADSASTTQNKIINSGNKMLRLSDGIEKRMAKLNLALCLTALMILYPLSITRLLTGMTSKTSNVCLMRVSLLI